MNTTTEAEKTLPQPITGLAPVFVVGFPRSGTTLVQQILSAHQELWTTLETHLFDKAIKGLKDWETRSLQVEELPGIWSRIEAASGPIPPQTLRERLAAKAKEGKLTAGNLLAELMDGMKPAGSTATRWLEKTPQHISHLPKIWSIFPDAKVIFVLRDPRDAISSRKPNPTDSNLQRTLHINRHIQTWQNILKRYEAHQDDQRLTMVRYEDLIVEPEHCIEKMATHIGIKPDITALQRFGEEFTNVTALQRFGDESTEVAVRYYTELKALNKTGSLVDRRGIWKQRLTPDEALTIELACAAQMKRYGYAPETPRRPLQMLKVSILRRVWLSRHANAQRKRRQ